MHSFSNFHTINGLGLINWLVYKDFGMSLAQVLDVLRNLLGFIHVAVDLNEEAEKLVGTSVYERRAPPSEAPDKGDCSSLIYYLFALIGVEVHPRAISLRDRYTRIDLDEIRGGDLVFASGKYGYFDVNPSDKVGHVGLVTNDGNVIHAFNPDPEADPPLPAIHKHSLREFFEGREPRGASRILPAVQNRIVLKIPDGMVLPYSADVRWMFCSTFATSVETRNVKTA